MTYPVLQYQLASFSAARKLANVHHGHDFKLQIAGEHLPCASAQQMVSALDYQFLNHILKDCSDLALAEYLWSHGHNLSHLMLRCAPQTGIYLEANAAYHWIGDEFSAAHFLPHVPAGHKCGKLHGHGFRVLLFARKLCAPALNQAWQQLKCKLQGQLLNSIDGLENPTSENLALWIFNQLGDLSQVSVQETESAACSFDGNNLQIYKQQNAECAIGTAGYSFKIRLHLSDHIDAKLGWVQDYAEVKSEFAQLYKQIDHHELSKNHNINNSLELATHLKTELMHTLPKLVGIDIVRNANEALKLYKHSYHKGAIQDFCL